MTTIERALKRPAVAPNALVATVLGGCYLLAGLVALAVILGTALAPAPDGTSVGVDLLRAAVYLTLGGALLLAATHGLARATNSVVGALYLAAGVVLLFAGRADAQLLTLNHPDNVIHLGTAALLLGFGRTQD